MANPSPYFTHMITQLTNLSDYITALAVLGLALGAVPLSLKVENDGSSDCATGTHEFWMAAVCAAVSVVLSLLSKVGVYLVQLRSTRLFGEDIDARLGEGGAHTTVIRLILIFAIIMLLAAFTMTALTVFYVIQVKTTKFSCMDRKSQLVLSALVPAPAISVIILSYEIVGWAFGFEV